VSATLAFGIAQALGLDYQIFALGAAVIPGDLIVLPPAPMTITIFDPLSEKLVTFETTRGDRCRSPCPRPI
jgi:hypothetical protein